MKHVARVVGSNNRRPSLVQAALFGVAFILVGVVVVMYSHADSQTTQTGATANTQTVTSSAGFVHPGILENEAQLNFVKAKIAANASPWTAAFNKAKSSSFGNTGYTPSPVATIDCTADANGCNAEHDDAIAAYTQALLWYYTGNRAYAQTSIRIMNAWSSTLTGSNGNQSFLNNAWSGETFPRAAEIIRYTFTPQSGETALNVTAFTNMLNSVILPAVGPNTDQSNYSNGNWDLSMVEASLNIAVFTDNRTLFDATIDRWKYSTRAEIYLTSDGPNPIAPEYGRYRSVGNIQCYWLNQNITQSNCAMPAGASWQNGQVQESCRDMGHTIMGLEAMTDTAETAAIQGVDLYTEFKTRMVAGYEFSAKYDAMYLDGQAIPAAVCGGSWAAGGLAYQNGWEIAYNALANRLGASMPYTQAFRLRYRPEAALLHLNWQTLTHADNAAEVAPVSPTPTATPGVTGDVNGDGKVNVFDLSILISNWGATNAGADLNHDGTVTIIDLSILLSHWTGG